MGGLLLALVMACSDDEGPGPIMDEDDGGGPTAGDPTGPSTSTSTSTGPSTSTGTTDTSLETEADGGADTSTSTSTGPGPGTSGETEVCDPITEDASDIGTKCENDEGCEPGYTCQAFEGIVLQRTCQIRCDLDCECPEGLGCMAIQDKIHAWFQCGPT